MQENGLFHETRIFVHSRNTDFHLTHACEHQWLATGRKNARSTESSIPEWWEVFCLDKQGLDGAAAIQVLRVPESEFRFEKMLC